MDRFPARPTPFRNSTFGIDGISTAEQRFGDVSALETAAGQLEEVMEKVEIQLRGCTDDAGALLIENVLQFLEQEASKMRSRADAIENGD